MKGKFLSAEWRKLVIFNFEVNPSVLIPYLPAHTELETFNGKHYLSLVGFLFSDTKVWGIKWPWHTNFLEVNLRFYVKRKVNGEWRRGVVFIREFVSKRLITFIANKVYRENYRSVGLSADIADTQEGLSVKYAVIKDGQHIFGAQAAPQSWALKAGSMEEFITEHYYGYTKVDSNKTIEYGVEHPPWTCYPVKYFFLNVDFETLYGSEFAFLNKKKPVSVYLAEGSEILVRKPNVIR
jgi:uncharacterized protein